MQGYRKVSGKASLENIPACMTELCKDLSDSEATFFFISPSLWVFLTCARSEINWQVEMTRSAASGKTILRIETWEVMAVTLRCTCRAPSHLWSASWISLTTAQSVVLLLVRNPLQGVITAEDPPNSIAIRPHQGSDYAAWDSGTCADSAVSHRCP